MAQTTHYDTLRDAENGYLVYRGAFTFADLQQQPAFGWLDSGKVAYQPKPGTINILKDKLKDCTLLVFMGTWCSDSRELVPRMYKVLEQAGYPTGQIQVYGLDRPKNSGSGAETTWKVTLVPTIIVLKNNKELGRITETTAKSVEEDLTEIVSH